MMPVNYLHTLQRLQQRAMDEKDEDADHALLAVLHKESLAGRKAASTELNPMVAGAGGTITAMAMYYGPFHPRYLELDKDVWEVTGWHIGNRIQPTALLYEGGDFPLVETGIPMIFILHNKSDKNQTLKATIHGYEGTASDRLRALAAELERGEER